MSPTINPGNNRYAFMPLIFPYPILYCVDVDRCILFFLCEAYCVVDYEFLYIFFVDSVHIA